MGRALYREVYLDLENLPALRETSHYKNKRVNKKTAFLKVIEAHQGIVNSLCGLYYAQVEDKKDAQQDVIVQLWKAWASFRGESKVSTWIYKVSLNTLLAKRRNEQRKIKAESLDSGWSALANTASDDDVLLLQQVIGLLNDDDKALVILYLEGYKNIEIAEMLEISSTNVGSRLNRIKTKLKEHYKTLTNYAG